MCVCVKQTNADYVFLYIDIDLAVLRINLLCFMMNKFVGVVVDERGTD